MTPQAILKARFAELAELLNVDFLVRTQTDKFYFTVTGPHQKIHEFIKGSFPKAWMTSGSGGIKISELVYGLPLQEVDRLVSALQIPPAWLEHNDSAALRIAEKIRETKEFGSLPILADALEEAGCDNAEILSHCRASTPHQEICWVVELLLGPARRRRRHRGPD